MILAKKLSHSFKKKDDEGKVIGTIEALSQVDLEVTRGQFVAVLGHNGSGKSTLAKHINALLFPTSGTMTVDGFDTRDAEALLEIRRRAGMIFQNPDNQIIGQVVEEDVAFGPENLGVPSKEIVERVDESLGILEMREFKDRSPNHLSGGQKQRVSIAGVIAMHPECIIMDEPTAMLDPSGRREVIRAARALNRVENITIILITHHMEEAVYADRVFIMDKGKLALSGTPREVFSQVERLTELQLGIPPVTQLAEALRARGAQIPRGILTREELLASLTDADLKFLPADAALATDASTSPIAHFTKDTVEDRLECRGVSYAYNEGSTMETRALSGLDLTIGDGEFVGLIGHTGSGKSTLVQLLGGLLKPSSGQVLYNGENINGEKYPRRKLREGVGLVFQYPEYQLFEADVLTDVCFGPKNLGLPPEEQKKRAMNALALVGLPEESYSRSPFDLSGGEKRRAAIAGVLAMEPRVLILDEPTAGLDPHRRDELLHLIARLNREEKLTILWVSHSMDAVASYADRILVMDKGRIVLDGAPREIFTHTGELEAMGLAAPEVNYCLDALRGKGWPVQTGCIGTEEAADEIVRAYNAERADVH